MGTSPARRVAAPLITECHATLECKVLNTRLVNKFNSKFNLFILEVAQTSTAPGPMSPRTIQHRGRATFVVDGETIAFRSKAP
jgi:flavin reductase (DIM6/NTAB) family NADH-FMN oxidoreductase RutF